MTDILDTMASASVTTRGEYIPDGQGILEIRKILRKNLNDGDTFIAEMSVVESSSKGDLDPTTKTPVVPNAPGAIVSFVQKLAKNPRTAVPNTKAFVCAVVGVNPDTVPPADFKEAFLTMVADANPSRGMRIRFSTYQQETKDKKSVNTYPRFFHMAEGNSPDEIAARAKSQN